MSELIVEQARAFLEGRFRESNSAAVYFQDEAAEQAAHRDAVLAFDESMPDLAPPRLKPEDEICLVSVPNDPAGTRFAELAEQTLTEDAKVTTIAGTEDIVFHREQYLSAADLPHLGALAREAFVHVTHADQAAPHARCDVNWQPVGKE
jgi:hypothetical protein